MGCLSHTKKYWIVRLDYEDIICLESKLKATTKIIIHGRMYESTRKSYIIKLYRKLMIFETWIEVKSCLESIINWKKNNLHDRM